MVRPSCPAGSGLEQATPLIDVAQQYGRAVKFKNTSLSMWLTEELEGMEIGHYHTDRDRLLNRTHPVRNVLMVSLGLHVC